MADRIPHDEFVAKVQARKALEKEAKAIDGMYLGYKKDAIRRMEIRKDRRRVRPYSTLHKTK